MPRYDFTGPRLYIDAPLAGGAQIKLDRAQANYLLNVLRLKPRDGVLLFNGRDGEWRGMPGEAGKRGASIVVGEQTRAQPPAGDLHVLFAPLKHARLDYMVQKAVEMGATSLQPVLTRHTQVARVNLQRMRANAIEAAEQCGILTLPEIAAPVAFKAMLAKREPSRLLIFCDEDAPVQDPVAALAAARPQPAALVSIGTAAATPLAVLLGPEGGFAEHERAELLNQPNVLRLALGPRILRADTAAIAALTLVQAVLGDWRGAQTEKNKV